MFLFLRISMVPGKKKVVTIDAISSTQDNFGVLIKSIVLCKCFALSFVERNQIKVTPNDIFISVTFRIFDSLLITLS